MNAKTRYRKRLKLRSALARVLEILASIARDGIRSDRTTAQMASVVTWSLAQFAKGAGVEVDLTRTPEREEFASHAARKIARRNETIARYQRIRKQNSRKMKEGGDLPHDPGQ